MQNFLAIFLFDRYVAMFEVLRFVGPQSGVAEEQHVVVKLLCLPAVLAAGLARVLTRCLIKLLVLIGAEPGPMHDLALGPVRWGKIGQMVEPAMANGGL